MTSATTIEIEINARNPAQYLACCGIFEIVSRFDADAVSRWETEAMTRFVINTKLDEAALVALIVQSFTNWKDYWCEHPKRDTVAEDRSENEQQAQDKKQYETRIDVTFKLKDFSSQTLKMDWWYETLKTDGDVSGKSAWKMYAGQLRPKKTAASMVSACAEIMSKQSLTKLAELLNARIGMTGRFGFDPSSSRNALDVGYSPNDVKLPVATYPFIELLAMIGAQYFFPQRTRAGGGYTSTRGFVRRKKNRTDKTQHFYFRHCMWHASLPIVLARGFACGSLADEQTGVMYESWRASRKDYGNLSPSVLISIQPNDTKGKSDD